MSVLNSPQSSISITPIHLRPNQAVLSTMSYSVPRHPAPIDLKLDSNEGAPPSEASLQVIDALSVELLNRYPKNSDLTTALAERYDVSADQVLVTAGADEALDRACRAFLEPGRVLIYPRPSFEMIPRFVTWSSGTLIEVEWDQPKFPIDDVLKRLTKNTSLIAVVSPNNPTGAVVTRDQLIALSAAAPHALILLDHAYVEFVDSPELDLTETALALPNVCVFRTFSKAWGIAGLRVGFVLGPAEVISWLKRVGNPYSVASTSLYLALKRLTQAPQEIERSVKQVQLERVQLRHTLGELGIESAPSQGNFVFFRTPRALWIRDALAGLGIGVRAWPGHPELSDALRITCPSDEISCIRVKRALMTALRPQALLFDLDGVLAEVSESYRAAIIETCATYEVVITPQEIAEVKGEGDANNDWVVTQRLLKRRGIDAKLNEVTRRFEQLYQGTSTREGLYLRETLIPSLDLIQALCARFPAAIVTGRPKGDAQTFLERFMLTPYFQAVVTMEDAELKPSPAPVKLALSQLGVERAWMIGDTVDDLRAARGAGVVPLGILTPAEPSPADTRAQLERAGAARVFTCLAELLELLS